MAALRPVNVADAGSMSAENLFDITGQVALVTGAASGLGLAIAEMLADHHAKLALLDIDQDNLDHVSDRLKSAGAEIYAVRVDVSDRIELRQAFDAVVEHYGRLDIVFGNAGIGAGAGFLRLDGSRNPDGEICSVTDRVWDAVIAVNLNAVFTTIQSAAAHMKKQRKGRIIITTSIASFSNEGWVGTPYMPAKAGAAHLVRQAALELARYNITVNAIAPGAFATNIGGGRLKTEAVNETMSARIPLGRVAKPDDIKGLALFLASPASDFITGAEIPIDGGAALGQRS
jgi:NAD(P)-dependent dehydrogenase (short-subunit alcohol dehydrogenase family)